MFWKTKKTATTATDVAAVANSNIRKATPSVIAADLHVLGNIVSAGAIDIDGSIEGNVKGENVTLRLNSKIKGDVVAESVHVYGEVHGIIRAQSVFLYSSCHIEGVIIHQSLMVEDGAFIDGKFKRMDFQSSTGLGADETFMAGHSHDTGIIEEKPHIIPGLRLIS